MELRHLRCFVTVAEDQRLSATEIGQLTGIEADRCEPILEALAGS